jgi:serine/threonine-protein kinase
MYPQVFGKYVLERELSRGGMARVLLATLRGAGGFEKKLVVKQIRDELAYDDEFRRRFVEEAKTTVALSHPNIVTVYELGVELGTYFLAMELVEGLSCAELLKALTRDGARLTPEEGAYIGVEICRALDYAHRRMKVVHRDVTPRNVMLDEEGQVKVIDFGIAALSSVQGHEVFGSPGHMPPEQVDGRELTPATDVFAVAVLLLELWGGKAPFRRKDPSEATELVRSGPRPKPSDIDPRLLPLDDVMHQALAAEVNDRPRHADDLGRALRKFLSGVDLGDVARQLGDRVRSVRANPAPRDRTSQVPGHLERPASRPSATEIGTKTFAARDEVVKWSPTGEASTRAMPKSVPPAPSGETIETIATRPIETDGRSSAKPRRPRPWLVVTSVAGSMVLAFFGVRQLVTTPPATRAIATSTAIATPTAPLTATASATTSATARTSATPPLVASAAPTATDSAPVVDKPTLTLLGDPGTVVSVDGASRGACPTRVSLDIGAHNVQFTFPPTGESRGQRLTLRAAERVTLRADFTAAVPTIHTIR